MTALNKESQKMSKNPASKERVPTEDTKATVDTVKATCHSQPFVILPYEVAKEGHRRRTEP